MKKLAFVALTFFSASPLLADQYGRAGCGLGSMIFKDDNNQVIAATTNASSASQLLGISSGTSNCVDSDSKVALAPFVESNRVQITNDAAKGSGESLASLGTMMGCNKLQSALLNQHLQANFANVFDVESDSADLTDRILASARSNAELRASCRVLM